MREGYVRSIRAVVVCLLYGVSARGGTRADLSGDATVDYQTTMDDMPFVAAGNLGNAGEWPVGAMTATGPTASVGPWATPTKWVSSRSLLVSTPSSSTQAQDLDDPITHRRALLKAIRHGKIRSSFRESDDRRER